MASITATVSYEKQNGTLALSGDRRYAFWTPSAPPGAPPAVTVPVADITNLQQSKPDKPKVALKVFLKESSHVFSFTSKDAARKEQEVITAALSKVIAASKATAIAQLAPATVTQTLPQQDGTDGGASAALAMAKAVSSKTTDEGWYDDSKLKVDFQLQRALLESNKPLNDRFTQALRDKPESVSIPQFTAQFWSTRLHLLRALAIERTQKEGVYNVLPEIKYKTTYGDDGEPKKTLHITKDQIALLFKQYPIIRKAYNDNCPPVKDESFYVAFFTSRLLKKLKGERIEKSDRTDPMLDKYLDYVDGTGGPVDVSKVPHFIDLEGNEQNSKFKVNREGWEMSASRHDQPILHVLNNLSEKMLSHVAPEDGEAHGPIGMDEETFEHVRLRDLAMSDADNRIVLNILEQPRHVAGQDEDDLSADARLYGKQDPTKVLTSLRSELEPAHLGSDEHGTLRLDRAIGFHSESDTDSDDDESTVHSHGKKSAKKASTRVGSHASMTSASASLLSSIAQRRSQTATTSSPSQDPSGLSQASLDTLTITHNTTTEFLHYFWTLYLSGDASKAAELAGLVSTLDRSLDRIAAVGESAEKERTEKLERMRKQVQEHFQRTGKKRRIDESGIGGGKLAVDGMIKPTVGALRQAILTYRRAFEDQSAAAAAAAAVATTG